MKGPLFSYFGSKWRIALKYPKPRAKIVEMFAGSACYACRYPDHDVTLIERDPKIAAVWRYLIRTPADAIRSLPDMYDDTWLPDLAIPDDARWLMGLWVSQGSAAPRNTPTGFMVSHGTQREWAKRRERIAQSVGEIRHWNVIEGSWADANWDPCDTTYFVDPPYQDAGHRYPTHAVDYKALGTGCKLMHDVGGHVIVCEASGAGWLPFRPFVVSQATPGRAGARVSREMVWP
jgi:hypothetical protein